MTQKGRIPWSVFDLENDHIARKVFLDELRISAAEQRGDHGPCTCDRAGYQRQNANICRHCNKPHTGRTGNL